MRIRIVQCLCGPKRHALLAMAVMDPAQTDADVLELVHVAVKEALAGRGAAVGLPNMNPWCGIWCATTKTWMYAAAWSREFADEAEALRELKASEEDQRTTAALLDLLDLSYDATRRTKHEGGPMRLGCGQCLETFDTADAFVDHLLTTRHMNVPVDAESDDLRAFVEMITHIQAHATDGTPLPEGSSLTHIDEADIEDDDELTEEKKAELLAWMREPVRLPLSPLPDPETVMLGFHADGADGWRVELWLTLGQPRGEFRGLQRGVLKWRHAVDLEVIALVKAAADERPGAHEMLSAFIERLQAHYAPEA